MTYLWTVTSRPEGSAAIPSNPTSLTTTFFLDASGVYTLRFCALDARGEESCCDVTLTSEAPGEIHVELSWDTPYGDVDLHMLRPGAASNRWFTTDDCFWANQTPDWGPVGLEANPTLDRDDMNGYGPENITIVDTPLNGTYLVAVTYYCEHSLVARNDPDPDPIDPGSGPTEATVRIYCSGALVETISGINFESTGRWVDVAEIDWPSCTVRTPEARSWVTEAIDPTFVTGTPHCTIPCDDIGSGDECLPLETCTDTAPGPRTEGECIFTP